MLSIKNSLIHAVKSSDTYGRHHYPSLLAADIEASQTPAGLFGAFQHHSQRVAESVRGENSGEVVHCDTLNQCDGENSVGGKFALWLISEQPAMFSQWIAGLVPDDVEYNGDHWWLFTTVVGEINLNFVERWESAKLILASNVREKWFIQGVERSGDIGRVDEILSRLSSIPVVKREIQTLFNDWAPDLKQFMPFCSQK